MAKKVVVLNGSPRKNGNTSALVSAFAGGAESAGNSVEVFHLGSLEIHGCLGCGGGHSFVDDNGDGICDYYADGGYIPPSATATCSSSPRRSTTGT